MDLLLKISVLLAILGWLGDVEVMKCPWKETVLGKKKIPLNVLPFPYAANDDLCEFPP